MTKTKALFLDRDGVINKDTGYTHLIKDLEVINADIISAFKNSFKKYKIIIITNQSGVGRGYYNYEAFLEFNLALVKELKTYNIQVDDILFCPHTPSENCNCRKPKNLMFLQAQEKYNIDFSKSIMIGDKETDLIPARELGIKTIKI